MSSLSDAEWDQACANYQEAKAGVTVALHRQADAELARHRAALAGHHDPALTLEVEKAEDDVAWCRALVVACGEIVKGCTLEEAVS